MSIPKGFLAVMAALLIFPAVSAAPPSSIRVQGSLSDRSGGTPVPANGSFPMTFRLYDDAIAGTLVATSGPSAVQVTGGLYNADVAFPPASFNGGSLFLEVQVNAEILAPRIAVSSVPFAYVAAQSTSVAPGSVTSAGLAPGAVTPDKLAIPCADGQVLAQTHGITTCMWQGDLCKPGAQAPCYGGPPNACGPGTPGLANCTGGTFIGASCVGWIPTPGPQPEICDGIDNDCNGQVDDGNPVGGATGTACTVPGLKGPCAQGATSCAGGPMHCAQTVFPAVETCNGIDDNCNGLIDDNQLAHSNGVGGTYNTTCATPLGTPGVASTYTEAMAMLAKTSWIPPDGVLFENNFACNGGSAVEKASPTQCVTWIYTGPNAGDVNITSGAPGTCCSVLGTESPWY